MKIAHITAGAGAYHCGNCIRDNGLVLALRRLGHDALMTPLYLPTVPDDTNAAEGVPIFYGGVNVYLQQKISLFRHTPRWIDRWFDHPALLRLAAKQAGMTKAQELGEMTLSTLRGDEGPQVKELRRLGEWLRDEVNPDVICLSNALLIGMARTLKQMTGVPVVCTLQGEDGFLDHLPDPFSEQSWAVLMKRAADVDAFIPVSRYYADVMRKRLDLPQEKIHVVPNGISLKGYREERELPDTPTLGYMARLCPDKGLHTLVEAFILLKERFPELRLRAAGAVTGAGDQAFVEMNRLRLAECGYANDAEFHANVSREDKISLLESLTVFSTPALYGEAFGLYVLESLAAGVPVVQPRHAGFTELLEATGGGILYDGESPDALADALSSLLSAPERACELGDRGRAVVRKEFSEDRMAERVAAVFESICSPA